MKLILRSTTWLMFTACLSFHAAAAEPKSYPLLCKGGGTVTLNFPPMQSRYPDFNGTIVGLSFWKSTHAATAGIEPGHCAWMDRGLNDKEPSSLILRFPGAFLYISAVSIDGVFSNVYRYDGDQVQRTNMERFVTAVMQGREFQVYAYNDGRDLIVTRFGP